MLENLCIKESEKENQVTIFFADVLGKIKVFNFAPQTKIL